jgi:hypothetical protein
MWDDSEWPEQLRHWEYIASLPSPSTLLTPMYFTVEELRLLEGTNLHGAVHDREAEWRAESERVKILLKEEGLTWYVSYVMRG